MMGKAKTQQRLIDNLEDEFAKVLKYFIFNNSAAHIASISLISQVPTFRFVLVVSGITDM